MRVGVIGINHKLANLKLREKLAHTCQKLFGNSSFNFNGYQSIILSTCNRTEVYFSSDDLPALHSYLLTLLRQEVEEEFDQKLYSFFGVDCFTHLTKVASGLDSAILGETEILGQVKIAYETALDLSHLSKDLHFLFQKSLTIAKKIRTHFHLNRGILDLEHAIFHIGKQFFSSFKEKRLLFIGASSINQKVLHFLKSKSIGQICLCNRTDLKSNLIATKENIQVLEWSRLDEWVEYDWIICGTKSSNYLINCQGLDNHLHSEKLIMDLSVPRNVDPEIMNYYSFANLFNIDDINQTLDQQRIGLLQTVLEVEQKIQHYIYQYSLIYSKKQQSKVFVMKFSA